MQWWDGRNMAVVEKGKLPARWSAQCCEMFALLKRLQQLRYQKGAIYTDSRYANVVHTFGKNWVERGFVISKGKTLIHENLIKEVLEALKDPVEIAVVPC